LNKLKQLGHGARVTTRRN